MKKLLYITLACTLTMGFTASCEKEVDHPPINALTASQIITIDSLRNWQASVSPGKVSIQEDLSVYGIVTMDESEGNIYKAIYVQDHTAGINVRMSASSDFLVGDSVRISLKGAIISEYAGVIQLDSIDPEKAIVRQSSGNTVTPELKTIDQITTADEGRLIRIANVQFMATELPNTFADAPNQSSENRMLEDCDGNSIIVRTSGFSTFAGTSLPELSGDMIAIVNQFNGEIQLLVRSSAEVVNWDNARCAGQLVNKNFDDDDVTSGGWIVQQVVGTETWTTGDLGGAPSPYGVIDNYSGSNTATESWLISPSMDLSNSTGPTMSFINAYNYAGDPLELLISINYSGTGNPNGATWTALPATWSSGSWAWVNSGIIDLSAYLQSNVRIAFKYTGSNSDGSTWEIDDIIVNG